MQQKPFGKEFYIEVFNPCWPNKGRKVRVFRKFVRDALSPSLITLYKVTAIDSKDALALTLMGKATIVIGGSPSIMEVTQKPWHGIKRPV